MVVNPEQAKVVKLIYKLFLTGLSYNAIGHELMKLGIKSPTGKERWYANTVHSILTSEKMKGDALLQKNFTVDFLTKKVKKNEGEIPQYLRQLLLRL
ncbi:recombinase family protein [Selenomonas ruminantium]|uniref:recombinase family protein n=1 Tax=Selenomonas ruminantium TaxID=971 RepID=UPI0026EA2F58|nr:recombinase family protein [Selenomonas ruminantium]